MKPWRGEQGERGEEMIVDRVFVFDGGWAERVGEKVECWDRFFEMRVARQRIR